MHSVHVAPCMQNEERASSVTLKMNGLKKKKMNSLVSDLMEFTIY